MQLFFSLFPHFRVNFYPLPLALDVKGWLILVVVILCKCFELYALLNDCFLNIASYAMKLSLSRQFRGEDILIMFTFMLN